MKISVRPQTYIYIVFLFFLVPLPWLSAWFLAVLTHELFHICAVYLFGGRILSLSVGANGVCMESTPLTEWKRIFSILSGPIGGLLPVLLGRWFPRIAICCWLLTIYNLLPFLPLDGGRALQIAIKNQKLFILLERICFGVLTLFAFVGMIFCHLGPLPLFFIIFLWIRNRKFPCK